jgi:hypothetical protein
MSLTDADKVWLRAQMDDAISDYNARLWGEGGSAGEFQQRTDARILDILNNKLPEIKLQLDRIEDDTDDGTPVPA